MKDKKRILKFLDEIQWLFDIQNYEKALVIQKEDEEKDGYPKGAEIFTDKEYRTIEIKIYPCFFKEKPEKQRKVLLHELCHVITYPQKQLSYDMLDGKMVTTESVKMANEEATSIIENILDSLLRGSSSYAKRGYKNYLKVKKTKKRKK